MRSTGIRYYPSKDAWFAYINKVKVRLASGKENRAAAERRYFELGHASGQPTAQPTAQAGSVAEVCDAYLTRLHLHQPPKSYRTARHVLRPFVAVFGDRKAASLTHIEVNRWLGEQKTWGPSTLRICIGAIKAAWNYQDPPLRNLAALKKPKCPTRTEAHVITPEQHAALLAAAPSRLVDVLIALEQTGHRPGAILTVEASECRDTEWVLAPKPGRKLKEEFAVFLTPAMQELTCRLVIANPAGPIFRTPKGKAWREINFLNTFRAARIRAGLPDTITPYSYRHAFGTRMAVKLYPAELARIMATSVTVVMRHYYHADRVKLRDAMLKAMEMP